MNENLRNNKEAGSPEKQKYKRDDAQLSALAIDLGLLTYSMRLILTTNVNSYLSLKFADLIKESEARRHLLIL